MEIDYDAWIAGWHSHLEGLPPTSCPYCGEIRDPEWTGKMAKWISWHMGRMACQQLDESAEMEEM